ncbi:MAG: flippase-like domain-containing protein [Bacilli bacterium]|nr:flippase-like domain-containing protein [Bacilli bacterium]
MKNKNKSDDSIVKKSFISGLIFIFIVIVVFYFIFKDNNAKETLIILLSAKRSYLLIAIICMSLFSICEAFNLKTSLNLLKEKVSFKQCYKYALAGFFVAGITPSSTGGDPMQFYLMSKDKVKSQNATLALLLKLLSFQISVVFIGIIGLLIHHKEIFRALGNLKYIIFLGAFLNIVVGTLYFLIIFFKKVIMYLVNFLDSVLKSLHIKKREMIINKITLWVEEYSKASSLIKENKEILVKLFSITIFQMIFYYSIPYFVYRSLGLDATKIFTFISFQSVLFISVSALPFPGAVGVSEVTFMRIYGKLFPKRMLGSAMIITRFINFYVFIIYSGIVLCYHIVKSNNQKR